MFFLHILLLLLTSKDAERDLRSENDIVFEHKKPRMFKCEQNFYFSEQVRLSTDYPEVWNPPSKKS